MVEDSNYIIQPDKNLYYTKNMKKQNNTNRNTQNSIIILILLLISLMSFVAIFAESPDMQILIEDRNSNATCENPEYNKEAYIKSSTSVTPKTNNASYELSVQYLPEGSELIVKNNGDKVDKVTKEQNIKYDFAVGDNLVIKQVYDDGTVEEISNRNF